MFFRTKLYTQTFTEIEQRIQDSLLSTNNDFLLTVDYFSSHMGELFYDCLIWLNTKVMPIRLEILRVFESMEDYAVLKLDATDVDIKPFIKKALLKSSKVKVLVYQKGKTYRVDCAYANESQKT